MHTANYHGRLLVVNLPMQKKPSLAICVVLDIIGNLTYIIPGLGETFDIAWAPISGIIYFYLFRGWRGIIGGGFSLAEELLPATDIIPTFTLTWFILHFKTNTKSAV